MRSVDPQMGFPSIEPLSQTLVRVPSSTRIHRRLSRCPPTMHTSPAFLPGMPLRFAQRKHRVGHAYSPLCCSSSRPASRRVFLRRLLCGTTTVLLSSAISETIYASAEPESSTLPVQSKAWSKPRKVTWGYVEENGPTHWGTRTEEWALCDTGMEQSPVALSYREVGAPGDVPRPTLNTATGKITVRMREVTPGAANKSVFIEPYIPPLPPLVGDAPPVDVYKPPPPLAVITLPDVGLYVFRSCHFHVGGSEHTIDGNRGVMETHFIFDKSDRAPAQEKPEVPPQSPTGDSVVPTPAAATDVLATATTDAPSSPQTIVVGLLGSSAPSSAPWLRNLLENFPVPETEADSRPSGIAMDIDFRDVLPDFERTSFYTYSGSLTTPPGTEGIYWLVLEDRMNVAEKDIQALMRAQNGSNVRPLQPLNSRMVIRFPPVTLPGQ